MFLHGPKTRAKNIALMVRHERAKGMRDYGILYSSIEDWNNKNYSWWVEHFKRFYSVCGSELNQARAYFHEDEESYSEIKKHDPEYMEAYIKRLEKKLLDDPHHT